MSVRTFEDSPAVLAKVPLLVGLIGPSGTGKTFSALRLATGMQRVNGREIFVVDTEAKRALHYAKRFKFRHVPFGPPFNPLAYVDVLDHCARRGAGTIIVDSASLEHEGEGGVLEMHEAELGRLAGNDTQARKKLNFLAWAKPKGERRRLIQRILQLDVNMVFCFRSKQKLKMRKGEEPEELGWQPIAGGEFAYEMTVRCLMLPGCNGVPTWKPEQKAEREVIKLPEQFRELFGTPHQLSEDIGEQLARWAAGGSLEEIPPGEAFEPLMDALVACVEVVDLEALLPRLRRARDAQTITHEEYGALRAAYAERKKR